MSRTFKDRPFWVRSNDVTETRYEHHNHGQFGEENLIRCPVKDENGDPVYELKTVPRGYYNENGSYVYSEYSWYALVTEVTVASVTKDYCTINEAGPSIHSYRARTDVNACSYILFENKFNRPLKKEKKIYHGAAKAAERAFLVKAAKLYNNGWDAEEFETETMTTRTNMHRGWWN